MHWPIWINSFLISYEESADHQSRPTRLHSWRWPPASADLAERTGAGLVWMGNFGWDDIYQPGAMGMVLPLISGLHRHEEAYSRGQLLLRCPLI